MLDLIEPSHSGRSSRAVLAVGREQRLRLDRVAERRAGAVRLDRVHLAPASGPRSASACADHPLLRGAVRRRQPVARAVLVDRAAAHHRRAPGGRCAARRTAAPAPARPRPRTSRCRRPRPRTTCSARRGASPRWRQNSTNSTGRRQHRHARRPAPASTRPPRSAWQARCSATSEEEHAVSTVTAGPSRPKHVRHPARDHAGRAVPVSR